MPTGTEGRRPGEPRRRFNLYELGVLGGVAFVVLVALLLDANADTERRATPSADAAPAAPALSRSRVRLIARRVERIRRLRFKQPVRPLFVSRERAKQLIDRLTRNQYPPHRRRIDEEQLKLLGLLRPSDDLGKAVEALGAEEILGFYDDRSKRLVVIREQTGTRALLELTLAHELVHALEDQHFAFRARRGLSDDAALGESALAEGTATEVMTDYARRYLEPGELLDVALGAVAGSGGDLPDYVKKTLMFPYEEGQRFVAAFRGPNGSWRALDRVLRLRHPRSAEQVLHPRKYGIDERPARVAESDLSEVLGKGWRPLDATSVGELDLQALYEIVGGSAAPRAAAGWGGGRFELWRLQARDGKSCRSPCIPRNVGLLRLVWDTVADRAEAEARFPRVFERGLDGRRVSAGRGPGLWLSRGGAIAMTGRGRGTTIVFAPSARLAARVLLAGGR